MSTIKIPYLSILIWLPIIMAALIPISQKFIKNNNKLAFVLALSTTIISLAISIIMYLKFNNNNYAMQFTENHIWIAQLGMRYYLGIDGISLAMIILTNFTSFLVILATYNMSKDKFSQYLAYFLLMQGISVGIFATVDALLFYVFWETLLIPMYLCIGMWGDYNRNYASVKFFMYSFLGSALMLVAILYLALKAQSFAITDMYKLNLPFEIQAFIFVALLLAFAVKVPLWPVHTWLPDVHSAAPVGGSVVLAALMLKMGIYGFFRFILPIVPLAARYFDWCIIILALIAIIYIGLLTIVQKDMKRLIAYSSIAHMGFAVLACFMIYLIIAKNNNVQDAYLSLEGAVVQMISHAFSTGGLFLAVGFLSHQGRSREIKDYQGLAHRMPIFSSFVLLFILANLGLPGTSGFVGEFMIIMSALQANIWIALAAATTLILAATYSLWFYNRVFFGAVKNERITKLHDINVNYIMIFTMLAIAIIFLGVYPNILINLLHSSVHHLLTVSIR